MVKFLVKYIKPEGCLADQEVGGLDSTLSRVKSKT